MALPLYFGKWSFALDHHVREGVNNAVHVQRISFLGIQPKAGIKTDKNNKKSHIYGI